MPRFSNGKTSAIPGSAESSAVRSAHTSMTVRIRSTGSCVNDESWSLVKQTTSQRPLAGRCGHSGVPSTYGSVSGTDRDSDGNRFSNTTTS